MTCMYYSLMIYFLAMSSVVLAKATVTKEAIGQQQALTKIYRLKNQIPVIFRSVENSDILQIQVSFKAGMRDLPMGLKVVSQLLFSVMPKAAAGYPKETIYRTSEKYALQMGCSGGIEVSSCSLGTINDYWKQALPMFAATIKTPTLNTNDIDLQKQQIISEVKAQIEDPSSKSNDNVNKVFYPSDHPYFQSFESTLDEIPKIKREQMLKFHKEILNANRMVITIATSVDAAEIMAVLNHHFGRIYKNDYEEAAIPEPKFDGKNSYDFEDRDIPTAYIKLKFNAPSVQDKDAVAAKFLFRILDEELGEEIRTKRSLSYATYSFTIQYALGIGVIGASTSKPKETLIAMADVIRNIKSKTYTKAELEEHKQIYATSYFLTQEEHSSLVGALSESYVYHNSVDNVYEFPIDLDRVTPKDIQNLAGKLLTNFRIGVIFGKDKFEEKWATDFIKNHLATH